METIRAEGRAAASGLLRALADGVATGWVLLGDARIECPADVSVTLDAEDPSTGTSAIRIRLLRTVAIRPRLAVQLELDRPGD